MAGIKTIYVIQKEPTLTVSSWSYSEKHRVILHNYMLSLLAESDEMFADALPLLNGIISTSIP